MEKQQLEIDFESTIKERKSTLFNKLYELKSFFETTERIVGNQASQLEKSDKVAIKNIKADGDIIGLLPSSSTVLKHFHNLDKLSEVSGLSLKNHEESAFLQRFYKFFIKNSNKISTENKAKLLDDASFVKEIWTLNNAVAGNLLDSDFANLVKIYKIKLENNNQNADKIAEKFKTSKMFQRNLDNIMLIHSSISEDLYDFDFINQNIYELLAVSYIQKSGISKTTVTENLISAYETLKKENKLNFEKIFSETKNSKKEPLSRKNPEIDVESWLMIKIVVGNSKTNQLKFVKENLSILFTKKLLTTVTRFAKPNTQDTESLNRLLEAVKYESLKSKIKKELMI